MRLKRGRQADVGWFFVGMILLQFLPCSRVQCPLQIGSFGISKMDEVSAAHLSPEHLSYSVQNFFWIISSCPGICELHPISERYLYQPSMIQMWTRGMYASQNGHRQNHIRLGSGFPNPGGEPSLKPHLPGDLKT